MRFEVWEVVRVASPTGVQRIGMHPARTPVVEVIHWQGMTATQIAAHAVHVFAVSIGMHALGAATPFDTYEGTYENFQQKAIANIGKQCELIRVNKYLPLLFEFTCEEDGERQREFGMKELQESVLDRTTLQFRKVKRG